MNDNSRLYDPIRQQSSYNPFAMDNWKRELKSQTYENAHQQPLLQQYQQPQNRYQQPLQYPQNQQNQQNQSRHPSDFMNKHHTPPLEVDLMQNEDRFKKYSNKMDRNTERNMQSHRLNQRHYVIPTSINSNYVDFSYKNQNNLKMNKTSQLLNNISSRNRVFDTHVNYRRHVPIPVADLKPINTSDIDYTNKK